LLPVGCIVANIESSINFVGPDFSMATFSALLDTALHRFAPLDAAEALQSGPLFSTLLRPHTAAHCFRALHAAAHHGVTTHTRF